MRARGTAIGWTAAIVLALPAAADAAAPATVDANGNAFTGGLSFSPTEVTVPIGGVVRWTNTDFVAPHTATEDHGLWSLSGSWGATPINPPGFAPGASVQRAFEAGTTKYYCVVHPVQMRGTIAVPVTLAVEKRVARRKVKRKGRKTRTQRIVVRTVMATWAVQPPANGQAFDAEVRRGGGPWQPLASGTRQVSGRIGALKKGTVTHVRARLRSATDANQATGWSPDASVTSG